MIALILLEIVVFLHFAFVVFIVFGAVLAQRWRWVIWVHFPALLYGLLNETLNIKCPMAIYENALRDSAAAAGYDFGILAPFLIEIIYPAGWNQAFGYFLAFLLLLFNIFFYMMLLARRGRAA